MTKQSCGSSWLSQLVLLSSEVMIGRYMSLILIIALSAGLLFYLKRWRYKIMDNKSHFSAKKGGGELQLSKVRNHKDKGEKTAKAKICSKRCCYVGPWMGERRNK